MKIKNVISVVLKRLSLNVLQPADKNRTGYDCYAISPAHIEVLIKRHRVPSDKPALAAAKSAAGLGNKSDSEAQGAAKNLNRLYLVKR